MVTCFRSFSLKMSSDKVLSKFRGSLLGSLMGDCLGAPFEGNEISGGDRLIIQRYFNKMEEPDFKGPFKKYTDDTAMMRSMARFLIDKPEPDMLHLAKLFVNEYVREPYRGYGQNVVVVFEKLKASKYKDVFAPAREQFDGRGSYGNGSAMRIAPVPLYFYDDYDNMLNVVMESSKITHSNVLGINGAVLQSLAIQQAFMADPTETLDVDGFCKGLLEKMRKVESDSYDELEDHQDPPFCSKIKNLQRLLGIEHSEDLHEEVIDTLGNGISAYESVATAIYCFLRATKPIPGIETDDPFRRTIQYAITLGGDTDTIACMAGGIVGAYLGEVAINRNILKHCEKYQDIETLADDLYAARSRS